MRACPACCIKQQPPVPGGFRAGGTGLWWKFDKKGTYSIYSFHAIFLHVATIEGTETAGVVFGRLLLVLRSLLMSDACVVTVVVVVTRTLRMLTVLRCMSSPVCFRRRTHTHNTIVVWYAQ